MIRAIFLAIALIFSLTTTAQAASNDITGRASVIDGDTLDIHGQRIRLEGVDAPESSQTCADPEGEPWRCGQKAALALSDLIGQKPVRCVPSTKDRYGRTIATCDLDGEDLGKWLVANGWAVAYRHYSDRYIPDEEEAKAKRRGIWAGSFTMPWDYRHAKKQKTSTPDNPSCGSKQSCQDMASCTEARFYLSTCHLTSLDRDHDGTPCETLCN